MFSKIGEIAPLLTIVILHFSVTALKFPEMFTIFKAKTSLENEFCNSIVPNTHTYK